MTFTLNRADLFVLFSSGLPADGEHVADYYAAEERKPKKGAGTLTAGLTLDDCRFADAVNWLKTNAWCKITPAELVEIAWPNG